MAIARTAFAGLGAAALLASCGIITSIDRSGIPAEGGGLPAPAGPGGGAAACDPNTCPGQNSECRVRACDAEGLCGFDNIAAGEPCSDPERPAANVCNGMGDCVECLLDEDCNVGQALCVGGECVSASCGDGVKNGDETDVDCGGICPGCANGMSCALAADCASLFCEPGAGGAGGAGGSGGAGGAPAGGLCAPCSADPDCAPGYCEDPGPRGVCRLPEPQGGPCAIAADCQPGLFCAEGICCDAACSGACESCAGAQTGGVDGTCGLRLDGVASQGGACDPYHCDGTSAQCPTSCSSNADCVDPATCNDDSCG